jgi:C-terminal processing protease CtpA/Prc
MRIWIMLLFLASMLTATSSLADQDSALQPLDAAEQQALVLKIASLLRTEYVFPEVGERAAGELTRRARTHAFAVPRSRADFAASLTKSLGELTSDKHVRVRLAPATTGTRTVQELDPALDNFGVHRIEWLPGRIGYLKIDRFYQADESRASFDAALTLVGSASAVIVDLRENGGGSDANNLLASYFFAERILFNELRWRKMEPDLLWTDPSVRPRLTKTPLYILTSGRTFSAAEAFAYSMQQRKRAIVIGERTAGGANPNRYFPLEPGLAVSISIGTTVNPVSGTNWEGTGVRPDIEVPESAALATAIEREGSR